MLVGVATADRSLLVARAGSRDGEPSASGSAPTLAGMGPLSTLPEGPAEVEAAIPIGTMAGSTPTGWPGPVGVAAAGSGSGAGGDADLEGSRYRVVRTFARGGLGVVSVAIDAELRREVALKEIRPELADDPAPISHSNEDPEGATGP